LKASPVSTIGLAGALAGTLDITAACTQAYLMRGTSPVRVFQSVASGVLGTKSFDGGWRTAALGLLLHFFIATTAAAVFYFASRKITFLTKQWVIAGVVYGIAVYTVMYWVVVPLSQARPFTPDPRLILIAVLIHIFCVGLPIAWVVRKA